MPDHPNYRHEREAIEWARSVLDQPERYAILDTETTGVSDADEVIQIGVISPSGQKLFDTLIRPCKRKSISREATAIHGISMKMLHDQPTYKEASVFLQQVLKSKTIVTYNARFDGRLLAQTATFGGGYTPNARQWQCAMLMYAQFVGEWDEYRNHYRWHRLQGGDHSALGDCMATLSRIQEMARARRRKYGYEFWVQADEIKEGQQEATPRRIPSRERSAPRRSMPAFGISISLDEGIQVLGQAEQTPEEQDAELSEGYRQKLQDHERATSSQVASSVDIVKFLVSSYRELTQEEIEEAGTHLSQSRVSGHRGHPIVRCFVLIKKMESATPKRLYAGALSLKETLDRFTSGLPSDEEIRKEASTLKQMIEECGRNELFFRSQVIWSNEWEKARDRVLSIQKKGERKKVMNEFIRKIKDLCDARSFRGLKEERERFIDYVKAQLDHE